MCICVRLRNGIFCHKDRQSHTHHIHDSECPMKLGFHNRGKQVAVDFSRLHRSNVLCNSVCAGSYLWSKFEVYTIRTRFAMSECWYVENVMCAHVVIDAKPCTVANVEKTIRLIWISKIEIWLKPRELRPKNKILNICALPFANKHFMHTQRSCPFNLPSTAELALFNFDRARESDVRWSEKETEKKLSLKLIDTHWYAGTFKE